MNIVSTFTFVIKILLFLKQVGSLVNCGPDCERSLDSIDIEGI